MCMVFRAGAGVLRVWSAARSQLQLGLWSQEVCSARYVPPALGSNSVQQRLGPNTGCCSCTSRFGSRQGRSSSRDLDWWLTSLCHASPSFGRRLRGASSKMDACDADAPVMPMRLLAGAPARQGLPAGVRKHPIGSEICAVCDVGCRYLEAQRKKRSQQAIAQDFEARTALRNFARAQRMAEILQAKLARAQVGSCCTDDSSQPGGAWGGPFEIVEVTKQPALAACVNCVWKWLNMRVRAHVCIMPH